MKIKSDYVSPRCGFLTASKEYEVKATLGGLKIIIADNGFKLHVNMTQCACLDGNSWQEVTEVEVLRARVKELELRLNSISNMSRV